MLSTPAFVLAAPAVIAIPKIVNFSEIYLFDSSELKFLRFLAIARTVLITACALAVGSYAAPKIGLAGPFDIVFLASSSPLLLLRQLGLVLMLCLFILIGAFFLKKIFGHGYRTISEYFSISMRVQILQSIIEEIVFRWALISVLAYFLQLNLVTDNNYAVGLAIVLAALSSSITHVSDLISFALSHIEAKLASIVSIHFFAALCYGWLFFSFGLSAAIVCHVLVTVLAAYGDRLKRIGDCEETGWSF